ncbi:hypothetical protein G6O67_000997 [Ophiocordyceps sinensis]|uniref:Protein kinase domain-containing protein n=2 Tax=Ophiocordyceps sinensis TaxID=72228 RepID=A0A8H4PWP4_9HYPO|nr:metalloprotease m41 ftsh [Ophiocordyceps sinensis CO18]KAF4511786.1 hypothetical protein G6O67_000997 [Ophiocordyceps sinensis]
MDELEQLKRQLREEQRQRQEDQRQLREEQRKRQEDQRQLREDQRQLREEKRLREAAEEISRPKTLVQYLEACHSLQLNVEVVTKTSQTTKGITTDPTGRIYPKRIVPWDDFNARQQRVWTLISSSDSFTTAATLPSQYIMKYIGENLQPITSEDGLRNIERDVLENPIRLLVNQVYRDPLLCQTFGLNGPIRLDRHTNLDNDTSLSEAVEHLSLDGGPVTPKPRPQPRVQRAARGKGNRADQFCIYKTSGGTEDAVLAVEYKPPHKLPVDEILTGLEMEIQPDRDIINQDGFSSTRLAASVVTQLFSYMIGKGIQYGYVCTGRAFIFLHIADDPSTVYYSVCVPAQDVAEAGSDDDGKRLYGSAVAQVLAFVLQALSGDPPAAKWHDDASKLKLWPVEVDDILSRIPVTEPKKRKGRPVSPFKIPTSKPFARSPIRTRARCKEQGPGDMVRKSDKDDEGPVHEPSRAGGSTAVVPSAAGGGETAEGGETGAAEGGQTGAKERRQGTVLERWGEQRRKKRKQLQQMPPDEKLQQLFLPAPKPKIVSWPFCTQACLLGLVQGRPVDGKCPNARDHGPAHIGLLDFLQLIRQQLATDRDRDADCTPVHLFGSRGALFKVRLSSHGYTLVAKGVQGLDQPHLDHELEIYGRLAPIQGKHVPVCLGTVNLVLPWYWNSGVYLHFLFLSWGGLPLHRDQQKLVKSDLEAAVGTIFKALHRHRVLHRDAEPRNMVYNADSGALMLIDFERSEYLGRQPLGSIVANVQGLRRKRAGREKPKQQSDEFSRELAYAVRKIPSCVTDLARKPVQGLRAC